MKLLLFPLLASALTTWAVSCSNPHHLAEEGINLSHYWKMRQHMCDNEFCEYQKECKIKELLTGNGKILTLTRQNRGSKVGFPNCWDATE